MSTNFCTPACYTGKMVFTVKNNASKTIRNLVFTLQSDILKIIYSLPKRAK